MILQHTPVDYLLVFYPVWNGLQYISNITLVFSMKIQRALD